MQGRNNVRLIAGPVSRFGPVIDPTLCRNVGEGGDSKSENYGELHGVYCWMGGTDVLRIGIAGSAFILLLN